MTAPQPPETEIETTETGPLVDALRRPTPPEDPAEDAMTVLMERLAERAEHDGLLDVAFTTTDTPVGTLLLAATTDGLVRVAYEREDHDAVLARLAERISPRVLAAPRRLDEARRQLDEYFTHRRRRFDLRVDLRLTAGFRRAVLDATAALPYGATTSYRGIATASGNPRAVRAAGTALATNPVPIVVPCHRILRSDGALGGYVGGPEAKRVLLDLEHATA